MLVDDSLTVRMSLQAIVTNAGFDVVTAANGRDALEQVHAGLTPDLIITDLNMPHMDGITLVGELRQIPGMRQVPLLILTTESQPATRAEARAAGANGWLVKPIAAPDLLALIAHLIPADPG